MKDIVLASSNPGKVREINQLLAGLGMQVQPQSEFGVVDAEETGLTFVENANLKGAMPPNIPADRPSPTTPVLKSTPWQAHRGYTRPVLPVRAPVTRQTLKSCWSN